MIITSTTHIVICGKNRIVGIPFDAEAEIFAGLCESIENVRVYIPKDVTVRPDIFEVLSYYESTIFPLAEIKLYGTTLTKEMS